MKKPKTLDEAIASVRAINARGFWKAGTKKMIDPVPNMSSRSGAMTVSEVETDEISDKLKFNDEEFELILRCAKKFPQLALYVHESMMGFHPIYALVRYKSPLIPTWNGEKEYEHLIKWYNSNHHCHMPARYAPSGEESDAKFLEELYSGKNAAKLELFGLPIRPISHYWY
jgi:hypothetical protein